MSKSKIQLYGKYANKEKDKDQLQKEQAMLLQLRLQSKNQVLNEAKNIRFFNNKLQRYVAQSSLNKIEILNCTTLDILDIIHTSHPTIIECFDIAEISKDIVSYSTNNLSRHLAVCGLQDSSYLNGVDTKVTHELANKCGRRDLGTSQPQQVLKWVEYWSCDPKNLTFRSFLNTISLSPHGDALVLGGNEFLSVWTRDSSMSTHSYSMYLYYAKDVPKGMFAQCLEEREVHQIIQTEFSSDGRSFLTLEQNNETDAQLLKVWYNVKMRSLEEHKIKKAFISRNHRRDPEKGEQFRAQSNTTNLDFLDFFQVPTSPRNGKIVQIRMLNWPQTFYAQEQIIPIAFIVITDKAIAQLWVENLNFSPSYDKTDPHDEYDVLTFSCMHTFSYRRSRNQQLGGCFDAQLLQQNSNVNSACFKEPQIDRCSSILDPQGDYIQLTKTIVHEKMFDNMIQPELSGGTSKDFLVLVVDNNLFLYSILGLRNFPTRSLDIQLLRETPLKGHNNQRFKLRTLLATFSDSLSADSHLSDSLSLICLSQEQNFIRLTKDNDVDNSQWKLEALKAKGIHQSTPLLIEKVIAAPKLPFIAIQQNQKSIMFYIEQSTCQTVRNEQVLYDGLKFIGQFLSYSNLKQIKWIPGLFQLFVLQEDGKLNIISSKTLESIFHNINIKNEDMSTLHHSKLGDVHIEPFDIIFDNILVKENLDGEIIDLCVLGTYFLSNEELIYRVNFIVMTTRSLNFFEIEIRYEKSSFTFEIKKLNSKQFGLQLKIHSILSELVQEDNVGKPYQCSNPKMKCLIQITNGKFQFEVAYVEMVSDDFKVVWQKVLPSQSAGANSVVQVDPRGGPRRSIIPTVTEVKDLDYDVTAKISTKYASVLTRSVSKKWYYLYLYEHILLNRYIGYIDLLDFIDFKPHDSQVFLKDGFALDYTFTEAPESETILLTCLDKLHIIAFNRVIRQWLCIRKVNLISGLDIRTIENVIICSTFLNNAIIVYNNQEIAVVNQLLQLIGRDVKQDKAGEEIAEPEADTKAEEVEEETSIQQIGFGTQCSKSIYDLSVLKQLYINGKTDFIMKILIQMNKVLSEEVQKLQDAEKGQLSPGKEHPESSELQKEVKDKISNKLNLTLQTLVAEVDSFVEAQVVQQDMVAAAEAEAAAAQAKGGAAAKKKDNHGGFFGSDSDDSSDGGMIDFDNPPPPAPAVAKDVVIEEKPQIPEKDHKVEQQFLEIYMDLLKNIMKTEACGHKQIIDFILIFKDIYAKDFFSDQAAATLLRQIYLETQIADEGILKELDVYNTKIEDTSIVKRLQDHEIYAQMYGEKDDGFESSAYQNKGKGNLAGLVQWDSRKCSLALFTVNQDVVLEELQARFDLESNASWEMVRRLCLPVWIKDPYKMRSIVEWIAKAAYRIAGEEQLTSTAKGTTPQSKAEATSLWYLLMNKKQILINLFEQEKQTGGDKVANMLAQDFSVERWKKAALKNAMVLRQKQRYLLAITFLLLGNDIAGALQIIKQNYNDPIMAILICRMLILQQPGNEELEKSLNQVYDDFFIARGKAFNDVYLQSIGLWNQKKFVQAVNVLQANEDVQEDGSIKYLFEQANGFQFKEENKKDKKVAKDRYVPLVSEQTGYELVKIVIKLKKAPAVTNALKSDEGSTGYGADVGDIFADFMGGPAKKEEVKKDEKKEAKAQLEVKLSKLLTQTLQESYRQQDMVEFLFMLRENREDIDPQDRLQMRYIYITCLQIIKDQLWQIYNNYKDEKQSSLHEQIDFLLSFALDIKQGQVSKEDQEKQNQLKIQKKLMQRLIEKEIIDLFEVLQNTRGNDLLSYELSLRLDARQKQQVAPGMVIPQDYCSLNRIILRMDHETDKFMNFIVYIMENPLLHNNNKTHEYENMKLHQQFILDLEQHVDCLIMFDQYQDNIIENSPEDNLDSKEFQFFNQKEDPVEEVKPKEEKKKIVSQFDDMFGGGDSSSEGDLMDFDLDAPKPQKATAEKESEKVVEPKDTSQGDMCQFQCSKLEQEIHTYIQRLNSKIKQSVKIYLSLLIFAYQNSKFYIVKDLLSKDEFMSLLAIETQQVADLNKESKLLCERICQIRQSNEIEKLTEIQKKVQEILQSTKGLYTKISFQSIKAHIQKFKRSILKKVKNIETAFKQQNKESDVEDEIYKENNNQNEVNINEPLWENDLYQAEEAANIPLFKAPTPKEDGEGDSPIKAFEGNETQILLGLLSKGGHITPQTYEFIRLWLQFVIINKTLESFEISIIDASGKVDSNYAQIFYHVGAPCVSTISSKDPSIQNIHSYSRAYQLTLLQQLLLGPQCDLQQLFDKLNIMNKNLEDQCTLFFQEQLQILQQKYVTNIICFNSSQTSEQLFPNLMKYFFKNQDKMENFWKALSISKNYAKPLSDQYLTLLGRGCTAEQEEFETKDQVTYKGGQYDIRNLAEIRSSSPIKNKEEKQAKHPGTFSATSLITRELLGTGIELFKQRGEQISDFAFDNTQNSDNLALGLMASGIREIPVVNTLLFRNRIESGLQLIDEENLKWEECLHRYEHIAQFMYDQPSTSAAKQPEIISAKDEPIIAAIDSLYCHKTIFQRSKPLIRKGLEFVGTEVLPSAIWNGSPSESYLAQTSKLDITHEDYTYPVESHPHLPLYMSGNRRGIICTWKFGQSQDKSLNPFMPEVDPRQADPKKACVKKIMFNQYGDKIMANNMEGSFSIYQIDCDSKHMRKVPIFSLYESMDSKVNDFDLVNCENIICTISQKQRTVKVYDTLLPYSLGRQAQVMEFKLPSGNSGGNMILCNQRKQTIYTFNGRTGAMTELDMRMSLTQLNQFQLSESHEITAACLNHKQDTLITGYKDGFIKIHAVDKYYEPQDKELKYLQLREKIDAFPFDFRSKKGTVQRMKINKNGALFASSQSGILKLVRTSV